MAVQVLLLIFGSAATCVIRAGQSISLWPSSAVLAVSHLEYASSIVTSLVRYAATAMDGHGLDPAEPPGIPKLVSRAPGDQALAALANDGQQSQGFTLDAAVKLTRLRWRSSLYDTMPSIAADVSSDGQDQQVERPV